MKKFIVCVCSILALAILTGLDVPGVSVVRTLALSAFLVVVAVIVHRVFPDRGDQYVHRNWDLHEENPDYFR